MPESPSAFLLLEIGGFSFVGAPLLSTPEKASASWPLKHPKSNRRLRTSKYIPSDGTTSNRSKRRQCYWVFVPPVPSSSPSGGGPAISSDGSAGGGSSAVSPQAGINSKGSARDNNQIFFIEKNCSPNLLAVNPLCEG